MMNWRNFRKRLILLEKSENLFLLKCVKSRYNISIFFAKF